VEEGKENEAKKIELRPVPEQPELRAATLPVEIYIASDGTVWSNRDEAIAYEQGLKD